MERSIKNKIQFACKLSLIFIAFIISINSSFANNALVIRGTDSSFDDVIKGMNDDLEGEVTLEQMQVLKDTSAKDIAAAFKKSSPKMVILIGNKAVNLYTDFQEANPNMKFPPAIAMAALFVDKFVVKLKNATAIRYEIPAVTSAVAMRTVLGTPVKRLGVIYREWMDDIIQENSAFCKAEGIELVGIKLSNKSSNMAGDVKDALKSLDGKVDALWILNDNSLLTKDALVGSWLPSRGGSKLPAIVGIKQFMTKIPLGSFAIVPDNYGLGAQAAGMIFEIMENDWELESNDVQQPVSVKKFINTGMLDKKGVKYQADKLNQVDEVIK